MLKCNYCKTGDLITKQSNKGPEVYCNSCRKIIYSSVFGVDFTASKAKESIVDCVIDGMPGFKGPGKNAKCHPYDTSNPESVREAQEAAEASFYATTRPRRAAKIVNALSFFEGQLPAVDATRADGNPKPPHEAAIAPMGPIGEVTTDGGSQIGDLNKSNPLNTASKKISELIKELTEESMGPSFCTKHNSIECGCNNL